MPIYFAGRTGSTLFQNRKRELHLESITPFKEIMYLGLTDIEIGNTYLILWQSEKSVISSHPAYLFGYTKASVQLPNPSTDGYCKFVVPHHQKERISILSTNNVLWEYDINGIVWEQIGIFRPNSDEYAVKIIHCGYNMLLTNLGRLLIMPDQLEITKDNVKFIDIAHGLNHVVLLGDDSNIYKIIIEMRQLENGNTVPNIIGPDLIPELFQPQFVQIAAGEEHFAAITEEGHLYTWGSNMFGKLGLNDCENDPSIPQLVRFQHAYTNTEVKVKKVACGNHFTICLTDDGTLWGTGDNHYCQFGSSTEYMDSSKFIKLDMKPLDGKTVKDLKCNENGTAIITE